MTTQPEALRLADYLDLDGKHKCAAELRRQHAEIERLRDAGVGYSQQTMDAVVREREKLREANAELLEALKEVAAEARHPDYDWSVALLNTVHAAIAKAEEVKP